jgi:hypothetical protein
VAAEILAAQTTSTGAAVREAIQKEITTRLRIDPTVKKAMAEAFAVVLDEFRDVTLKDSVVLESVGRQVHGVTGGQMQEFAQRLRDAAPRPLTEALILAWIDEHHRQKDEWPTRDSGAIDAAPGETWSGIDAALKMGTRELPGQSSLAQLLADHRGVRNIQNLPNLTEQQILAWMDAHHAETGKWPTVKSGPIKNAHGETWAKSNQALVNGHRKLPGGSSLAELLTKHRGVRNSKKLPPLSEEQILTWADSHQKRKERWPTHKSGSILEAPGETWRIVDKALRNARRGFTVRSSLAQFLAEHRGVRNMRNLPPLTVEHILAWADSHYERSSEWPTAKSGQVPGASGETWANIDQALAKGLRNLPIGSSLARLLAEHRGVRNMKNLPQLSVEQILIWADAHHEQTGQWPTRKSGPIADAPGETWANLDQALVKGLRKVPGESSLARLLAEYRGVRNIQNLPQLSVKKILALADAHHELTGQWPTSKSGPTGDTADETWANLDQALVKGLRGLPRGSSLRKLLAERADVGCETAID